MTDDDKKKLHAEMTKRIADKYNALKDHLERHGEVPAYKGVPVLIVDDVDPNAGPGDPSSSVHLTRIDNDGAGDDDA